MGPIRLIRDTAELSGTCYFEFLPGPYRDKCWNEGSVFLAEEVFRIIEPIIARNEPQFDRYSFVGIRRPTWERILPELERLAATDRGEVAVLAGELVAWLQQQLTENECVSVLGL